MSAPTTSDDGSCSFTAAPRSSRGTAWLLAVAAAALLVGRRRG
jgi:MYXO-CTERM domain-containing protein